MVIEVIFLKGCLGNSINMGVIFSRVKGTTFSALGLQSQDSNELTLALL